MTRRSAQIVPGDVPLADAAHRLGLTPHQFREMRPALDKRGFPPADPTTGLFDIEAIDAWRRGRNPHLFGLTVAGRPIESSDDIVSRRLEARRQGAGRG